MTEPTKLYGCVLYRNLPGHIKVKDYSVCVNNFHSSTLATEKPSPGDSRLLGRFVQYNGIVYYISMNHRVYETNIEPGRTVRFMGRDVAYIIVDNYRLVPVTMRKLDKVEWLFL